MTRRSRTFLTITYPRVSNSIKCCQGLQSPFQGRFLQPSWGSRTSQRLTPLTAYGGSHDYAWTSNLNAAQTNVDKTFLAYRGHHSPRLTSPAMQSGEISSKALCMTAIFSDGLQRKSWPTLYMLSICKNGKNETGSCLFDLCLHALPVSNAGLSAAPCINIPCYPAFAQKGILQVCCQYHAAS